MRLSQVRKLSMGLLIAAMLLALMGGYGVQKEWMMKLLFIAAIGCMAGYWVVLMKFWRCPKCGGLLPVKQHFYSLKHCPQCGQELDLS